MDYKCNIGVLSWECWHWKNPILSSDVQWVYLYANKKIICLLTCLLLISVAIPVQLFDADHINSILCLSVYQVLDDQVWIVDALSKVELALVAIYDISALVSWATLEKKIDDTYWMHWKADMYQLNQEFRDLKQVRKEIGESCLDSILIFLFEVLFFHIPMLILNVIATSYLVWRILAFHLGFVKDPSATKNNGWCKRRKSRWKPVHTRFTWWLWILTK